MSESPKKPPRRKRYAGTHPRKFHERYKELAPAKYPGQADKVRGQGRTPAGTHVPVMPREVMAALNPQPGQSMLDCTLGHGGHAELLARAAGPGGRVIGIDLDAAELERSVQRLRGLGLSLSAHHTNFAGMGNVLAAENLTGVDCLLADLGVSSMQLDRPERGFGFKYDGPLDMRMDAGRGKPAAELLRDTDAEALTGWLRDFGDEIDAKVIAEAIKHSPPKTTFALVELVLRAKGIAPGKLRRRNARDKHPAAQVFQALRMAVNREAENLEHLLRLLPYVVNPGGRFALITFHSGEQRRVQNALRKWRADGVFNAASIEPQAPTREEIYNNPRARSARLFTAIRL
jgi:16S rRNA (cytosine1402-N4)-methyltransferase